MVGCPADSQLRIFNISPGNVSASPPVTGVSFTWDFGAYPACSATVVKNCISGFQLGEISGSATTPTPTAAIALPAIVTLLQTIASPYTPSFTGLGNYQLCVWSVYVNSAGVAGQQGAMSCIAIAAIPPAPNAFKTTP